MLYSFLIYLMNYDKIKEMDFRRRLRVVVNLLKNSRNEVVDTPNGDAGNRMPANLRQVENIILSGEIADSIMIDNDVRLNFNVIQMEEERQKLQFTKEHPEHSAGLFSWRITICFKVVQMLLGMRILIFISDSSMSLIDALAILLTVQC